MRSSEPQDDGRALTADERERLSLIRYAERWRWRLLTGWIIIFTAAVAYGLIALQNTQQQGRKDRVNQSALVTAAEKAVCNKALSSVTSLLSLAEQQSVDPNKAAVQLAPYFSLVDPKQCASLVATAAAVSSHSVSKP